MKDLEQDVQNANSVTKNHEEKRVELQLFIQQTSVQIHEDSSKNRTFQDDLITENERLREECNKLKTKELTQTQTILQLTSTIREQEQLLKVQGDVANQLARQQELNAQLMEQKRKMQREVDTASDYIVALEDKVYKANKTSLELLKQLKDAEVEIETLKNYVIELKQRIAVYIPAKDDAIDKRLAEFINNYPERQKLKIMFLRESEGVYQFGTRRVAVRVDKDKINSILFLLFTLYSSCWRWLPIHR